MPTGNESVCVVMPVFNEAGCIESVCLSWLDVLRAIPGAILFAVDDGSTDSTASLLEKIAAADPRLRILRQKNGGHGQALRTGYAEALRLGAAWIFQVDSDNQFRAEDFLTLWNRRDEADFIWGVRQNRHDPALRKAISRCCRWLLRGLFGCRIQDPNTPFRLMRATVLSRLLPQVPLDAFAPNIFLSVLADREELALLQIPVTHEERKSGTPSLRLMRLYRVCFRCLTQLIHFRRYAFPR